MANELSTERRRLQKNRRAEKKELARLDDEIEAHLEAKQFLQTIARELQTEAHRRISAIVDCSLKIIFEEQAPEFRIDFEQKRGRTEARLVFVVNGEPVDPLDADSGGMVDVAAFALRLACIVLSRPRKRRLMVLDEPMLGLSKHHASRVGVMMDHLAEQLSMQIVMVTHRDELKTGTVHDFGG